MYDEETAEVLSLYAATSGTIVGFGAGVVVPANEQERCLMTGERWAGNQERPGSRTAGEF